MKYEFDKGCHSVYALQYHFIQCIKYRKKILVDSKLIDLLKQKVKKISNKFEVEVINIECDKDHYHMIIKTKPTLNIPKYINSIKTITSREIRRNFPEVKKKLWNDTFWSPSYCLITTGQTTLDQLKKYVESQGK